jgi:hypothetical protein
VHYHWLSSTIERLYVLRHYIRAWEDASDDPDLQNRIEAWEKELLECLRMRTWDTLHHARQLRREVDEGILVDAVEQALTEKAVSIYTVPIKPHPNQAVRLEVLFKDYRLNTCTARQEFKCEWDFGDIGKEEGWEIWHYFRNEKEARFSVSFQRLDGTMVKKPDGDDQGVPHCVQLQPAGKKKDGERRWIEAVRLAVALGVAILALIAGAREQLLKLDVFSGLVGVFLMGFGADTVKNLITRRPQPEA